MHIQLKGLLILSVIKTVHYRGVAKSFTFAYYLKTFIFYRHGVLASDELEEEYHDDIAFLLTKLKMLSESENVRFISYYKHSLQRCIRDYWRGNSVNEPGDSICAHYDPMSLVFQHH